MPVFVVAPPCPLTDGWGSVFDIVLRNSVNSIGGGEGGKSLWGQKMLKLCPHRYTVNGVSIFPVNITCHTLANHHRPLYR